MQLISKFDKGIRFLLRVIDIFSKYAWVSPLKDKKVVHAFQKVLNKSDRKPNKIWVDKGSEFYNSSFKKWLKDNDIEMYSTHNKGKFITGVTFIRTLKNKISRHMTSILKNVNIDKLDGIVNEYNNSYHRTIKMKPIDVKGNTYIDSIKEVNDKDSKFEIGDHVRLSKYNNIFGKVYITNSSEEGFLIKKFKNTVPWIYVINDLTGGEIIKTFYEKELQKTNQQKFRIEKSH